MFRAVVIIGSLIKEGVSNFFKKVKEIREQGKLNKNLKNKKGNEKMTSRDMNFKIDPATQKLLDDAEEKLVGKRQPGQSAIQKLLDDAEQKLTGEKSHLQDAEEARIRAEIIEHEKAAKEAEEKADAMYHTHGTNQSVEELNKGVAKERSYYQSTAIYERKKAALKKEFLEVKKTNPSLSYKEFLQQKKEEKEKKFNENNEISDLESGVISNDWIGRKKSDRDDSKSKESNDVLDNLLAKNSNQVDRHAEYERERHCDLSSTKSTYQEWLCETEAKEKKAGIKMTPELYQQYQSYVIIVQSLEPPPQVPQIGKPSSVRDVFIKTTPVSFLRWYLSFHPGESKTSNISLGNILKRNGR